MARNRLSQEEFIGRVESLGYTTKDTYKSGRTKVEIKCSNPEHASFFIRPDALFRGGGCVECWKDSKRTSQEEFVARVEALGYTTEDIYKDAKKVVEIKCSNPEHGSWFINPNNLFRGVGCPKCAESGFNPAKPAILYYFKVWMKAGYWIYKIGITNRDLKQRYRKNDWNKIHPLQIWHYDNGQEARDKEREILSRYASKQFTGKSPLKSVGNTEFFTEDILGIDNLE